VDLINVTLGNLHNTDRATRHDISEEIAFPAIAFDPREQRKNAGAIFPNPPFPALAVVT